MRLLPPCSRSHKGCNSRQQGDCLSPHLPAPLLPHSLDTQLANWLDKRIFVLARHSFPQHPCPSFVLSPPFFFRSASSSSSARREGRRRGKHRATPTCPPPRRDVFYNTNKEPSDLRRSLDSRLFLCSPVSSSSLSLSLFNFLGLSLLQRLFFFSSRSLSRCP